MRVIRRAAIALGLGAVPTLLVLCTVGWFGLRLVRGIDPPAVATASTAMEPAVREGDLVLLQPASPGDLIVGDVAALRDDDGEVVLRRVAARDQKGTTFEYRFAPDNRGTESDIVASDRDVIGEHDVRVPFLGYALVAFRTLAGKVLIVGLGMLGIFAARRSRPTGAAVAPEASDTVAYGGDNRPAIRETAMSIMPAELRHVRFAQVRKGYDTEAVDRALETVADSIEELLHERAELIERIRALESDVERYREAESTLTQTLTLAERAAEELKAEAQLEADKLLAEARAQLAATQQASQRAAADPAPPAPAHAPSPSSTPDAAFIELLGETRAIRSLLQALMTQAPGGSGGSPFTPRNPQ